MWKRVRHVAVTAVLLALPLSVASAQTGPTPEMVGQPPSAGPSGANPVIGNSAGNSGGPAGSSSGGDSLMPCPAPPPYTSRPCPAKQ
jgi:hypothetical protein